MASSEMDLDRTSLTTPEADLSISTSEKPVASHSSPSPSCEIASSEMDLDRKTDFKYSPLSQQGLIEACRDGNFEIVKQLLDGGEVVNAQNNNGWVALMEASENGHSMVVRLLLDSGALVNMRDEGGWVALMSAAHEGHSDVLQILLSAGADLNVRDKMGRSALLHAAVRGQVDALELLLEAGADVKIVDKLGQYSGNDMITEQLQTRKQKLWQDNATDIFALDLKPAAMQDNEDTSIDDFETLLYAGVAGSSRSFPVDPPIRIQSDECTAMATVPANAVVNEDLVNFVRTVSSDDSVQNTDYVSKSSPAVWESQKPFVDDSITTNMNMSNEDRASYKMERVANPMREKGLHSYCQRIEPCRSEEYDQYIQGIREGDVEHDIMDDCHRGLVTVDAEIQAYCKQYIHLAIDEMLGLSCKGRSAVHRRGKHGKSNIKLSRRKMRSELKSPPSGEYEQQQPWNGISTTITPQRLDLPGPVVNTFWSESIGNGVDKRLENRVGATISDHPHEMSVKSSDVANSFLSEEEQGCWRERYERAHQEELLRISRKFEREMEAERDFYRQLLCQKEDTIVQLKSHLETLKGIHHLEDQDRLIGKDTLEGSKAASTSEVTGNSETISVSRSANNDNSPAVNAAASDDSGSVATSLRLDSTSSFPNERRYNDGNRISNSHKLSLFHYRRCTHVLL
eukprot:gene31991-41490_t